MIKEKELFTGSLPFLAGVFIGRGIAGIAGAFSASQLMFAAVSVCLYTLFSVRNRPVIFLSLMFCGAFISATSSIPGVGGIDLTSFPPAKICSQKLRALIDAMPYESRRTNALLKALLSADRSSMTPSDKAIFRNSGASHLLALSGMHVGIIYMLLGKLLLPIGNSPVAKKIKSCISIVSIGFFTLVAGSGPSIVRAFLFIILRETASIFYRTCSIGRALSGALIIQLIFSPESINDIGFELSYLAMAGIVFIYPRLEAIYPAGKRKDPLRRLWNLAALSISCQILTGPLAWITFHTFPRHFLLTNILAAPLMTVIMFSAIACAILFALGCCPEWMIWLSEAPCKALLWVLETISSL